MRKYSLCLLWLLIAAALLSACGGETAQGPAERMSVREALAGLEDNVGKEIEVKGYPVAYFYSFTYSGKRIYNVYFSDTPEDFFGSIEAVEELKDDWIEAIVHEEDELWQDVRGVFEENEEPQPLILRFLSKKGKRAEIYYEFLQHIAE